MQAREESSTLLKALGQEIWPTDEKKIYYIRSEGFGLAPPETVSCESVLLETIKLATLQPRRSTNVQYKLQPKTFMTPMTDHDGYGSERD